MDELTNIPQLTLQLFGMNLVFNIQTIIMTLIVMGILALFGFFATKKIGIIPNPFQVVGELITTNFQALVVDALGEDLAKKYFPLIGSLFLFILLSNWLGVIPKLSEPTKDLNTPLGLGIMGFFIAHYCGIRAKGWKGYIQGYLEPIAFLAPLNLVSELSKVFSISFRLYGNIMGGAIIILVVSGLARSLLLPPLLSCFFGLFVGTIQAFVFTMLTLVYISLQVK